VSPLAPDHREMPACIDEFAADAVLPRHHHREGYASIILAGRFTEASFCGLSPVQPGDVLLHGRFDRHCDHGVGGTRRIEILWLPWTNDQLEGHFRIDDPDVLARVAETDLRAAVAMLARGIRPVEAAQAHWSHALAKELVSETSTSLREWSDRAGVRPEALSRGFRRHFGVSPKLYRLEARSRRAWRKVVRSSEPLTSIAYDCGFADLAHLSRSIRALTGAPPSAWRSAQNVSEAD